MKFFSDSSPVPAQPEAIDPLVLDPEAAILAVAALNHFGLPEQATDETLPDLRQELLKQAPRDVILAGQKAAVTRRLLELVVVKGSDAEDLTDRIPVAKWALGIEEPPVIGDVIPSQAALENDYFERVKTQQPCQPIKEEYRRVLKDIRRREAEALMAREERIAADERKLPGYDTLDETSRALSRVA